MNFIGQSASRIYGGLRNRQQVDLGLKTSKDSGKQILLLAVVYFVVFLKRLDGLPLPLDSACAA